MWLGQKCRRKGPMSTVTDHRAAQTMEGKAEQHDVGAVPESKVPHQRTLGGVAEHGSSGTRRQASQRRRRDERGFARVSCCHEVRPTSVNLGPHSSSRNSNRSATRSTQPTLFDHRTIPASASQQTPRSRSTRSLRPSTSLSPPHLQCPVQTPLHLPSRLVTLRIAVRTLLSVERMPDDWEWLDEFNVLLGTHCDWSAYPFVPSRNRPLKPRQSICPITGLPAVYKDPRTGVRMRMRMRTRC